MHKKPTRGRCKDRAWGRKGEGITAQIMELFASAFDELAKQYNELEWEADFRGEQYPPYIVMEKRSPPLFVTAADGTRTEEKPPVVEIVGGVDTQVVVRGNIQIGKKDLTKMVNRAAEVLELFLHGFMQEQKKLEAEKAAR